MTQMNKYFFNLSICGGYDCDGNIIVEANNSDEATTKAQDSFVNRWVKTFPELDVDYDVDLIKVEIDKEEVKRKITKARELCPGDEDLEFSSDGYEVRAYRYKESRGSAEWIDGVDVLWYEDDADLDKEFDKNEFVKYADAVSGF